MEGKLVCPAFFKIIYSTVKSLKLVDVISSQQQVLLHHCLLKGRLVIEPSEELNVTIHIRHKN